MNKRIAASALALAFAVLPGAALADEPYGTWVRPSTGTTVDFYECGGALCAKIVGVKDPAKKGTVGTVIMHGAKKVSAGKWEGNLLNTEDGNTYSGSVTMTGDGLHLKGCALAGLICSGETWRRK